MVHIDGKSKLYLPKFRLEPRGIPNDKFMIHTIGNYSQLFFKSIKKKIAELIF